MSPPVKVIEGYVHGGRIGVLVEIALDTSFTAGMAEFKQMARDLALQIAAAPVETVDALMEQASVKNSAVTVSDLVASVSGRLGERIVVTRFVRWDSEESNRATPGPPVAPAIAARANRIP